jgi:HAD superfamily hydrolase (TIGR01509 family)
MIKKIQLLALLLSLIPFGGSYAKVIIFDLGDTLVEPNKLSYAYQLGLVDIALYSLWDGNAMEEIASTLYQLLSIEGVQTTKRVVLDPRGHELPQLMCDWLAGTVTSSQVLCRFTKLLNNPEHQNCFKSKREKALVTKLAEAIFDPQVFAGNMQPVRGAIALVKKCSVQGHTLAILSNYAADSFDALYCNHDHYSLFRFFDPENIFISGYTGYLKPFASSFELMMKAGNFKPEECIFIDDQAENLKAAQACGITTIHLSNKNYQAVESELRKQAVLR